MKNNTKKNLHFHIIGRKIKETKSFFIVLAPEKPQNCLKLSNSLIISDPRLRKLGPLLLHTSSYITKVSGHKKPIFFIEPNYAFYANQSKSVNRPNIIYNLSKKMSFYKSFYFLLKLISAEK